MSYSPNGSEEPGGNVRDRTFERLVDSIADYAIFMLDPAGYVLTWNEGAKRIKGYSREEIIGSHFSRFYPQDMLDRRWPEHELEVASKEGRFEDESWRIRKDGSRFWANVIITALRDTAGKLIGFSKVTRDLTDRRRQQEELRQSEERFRTLVEGVRDYAVYMLDTEGRVATWNAGAELLKGYTAEEIIGSHISRFYLPSAVVVGEPEQALTAARIDGRSEEEGWRVRKDGSRFCANVIITAVRDANGTLTGYSKITRDLTELRQREQSLIESEERFRLIVESVTEYAIMMLDRSGFVASWNAGAERIMGYASHEIVGKHFSRFYTPEDVSSNRPWQQLLVARRESRVADESWRSRKNGSQFWAGSVITLLRGSGAHDGGYVLVMQDLTQRRHAETLADATRRMHEFIAMLAHELRNPLAPIRNAVELMGMKGLTDPTLEAMRQTIDRQTSHLTHILDELLDVNRVARGEFSIAREPVDIRDIVNRSVEASQPVIAANRHALSVSVPDSPMVVTGDPLRLVQVIVNLLNNAARYTPAGGSIQLSAAERGSDVVIEVRDNGRGIAVDDIEWIFDLFTQVEPKSVAARQGGLGVGLALVRRVVELHGGSVHARSDGVGKGSIFTISLPLSSSQAKPLDPPAARALPLPRRLRVLVVDDNKDSARSLRALLEAMGQDVRMTYDGRTALEAARRFHPELVLLDVGMPGMSGYEVAVAMRSQLAESNPVLVAVTGWGQEADRALARAHGFDRHFTKPVSAAALQDLLRNVAADLDRAR